MSPHSVFWGLPPSPNCERCLVAMYKEKGPSRQTPAVNSRPLSTAEHVRRRAHQPTLNVHSFHSRILLIVWISLKSDGSGSWKLATTTATRTSLGPRCQLSRSQWNDAGSRIRTPDDGDVHRSRFASSPSALGFWPSLPDIGRPDARSLARQESRASHRLCHSQRHLCHQRWVTVVHHLARAERWWLALDSDLSQSRRFWTMEASPGRSLDAKWHVVQPRKKKEVYYERRSIANADWRRDVNSRTHFRTISLFVCFLCFFVFFSF